jgi:hypothetical protein
MKKWIAIIFCLSSYGIALSQAPDTSVIVYGKGTRGPYQLGFRNLISGSFKIYRDNQVLSPDSINIEYADGFVELDFPLPIGDSLKAEFAYLPFELKSRYFLHTLSEIGSDSQLLEPIAVQHRLGGGFGSDLSISGSKGFSIQSGEGAQDGLSQSLNLTITGDLVPGLRTSAHISDKSSGKSSVSRRLDELDKIYIEAESDHFKGIFGDFNLVQTSDPLLSYQRKLTGLNAIYSKGDNTISGAAAFFPGEYSSLTINGQDGRLGPYYLTDMGGRQGAQILPGSERVYLDGALQKRGSQDDYQIDYEAGTVEFAPSKIIRGESRITIDYEISREEYSRNLYTVSAGASPIRGLRIYSNLLQEGDNKNSPKTFELTSEEKAVLDSAGAERLNAALSGVKYVGHGQGDYNIDTTGGLHYVYAGTNGGEYNVSFSFLGSGIGTYKTLGTGIFEYTGPGLGDYGPVILIPLPQMKRYGSFGSSWSSSDSSITLSGEMAGSLYDRNTFSNLDPVKSGVSGTGSVGLRRSMFSPGGSIGVSFRMRKIGRDAIFPGRIDDIERYRDYDLDVALDQAGEKVEEIGITGAIDRGRIISLQMGYLTHPDIKSRRREAASADWRLWGPFSLSSSLERTRGSRTWWKRSGSLRASYSRLQPSLGINFEKRDGIDGFKYSELIGSIPISYTQNINGTTTLNYRDEKYFDGAWLDKFKSGSIQQSLSYVLGASGVSGEMAASYYKKHYMKYSGTDSEQKTGWTRLSYADPLGRGNFTINERLGASNERLQAKNYIFVGNGKGDYKLEDGEYIRDPQGDYILAIAELGEGVKITEVATDLNGSLSPFILIDPGHKLENSAGRLNIDLNLSYDLKKSSNNLIARDFIPWKNSRFENISFQNGQIESRAYYYPPGGNHRIKYGLTRSFEKGNPFANESSDNDFRSDELSWAFPAGKKFDFVLAVLLSDSKKATNSLGYEVQSRIVSLSTNYRFAGTWVLTFAPSYEFSRETDTGLRAKMPEGELDLSKDLGKSSRISGKMVYTRMIISPSGTYVPYQLAQGKGEGDNFESNLTARMAVTKNGRFDMSYRFQGFARRSDIHDFRLEFVVLFL